MSSNPPIKDDRTGHSYLFSEQQRMTSITRKLHWYWLRKRILSCLGTDLLAGVLTVPGWCVVQEFTHLGAVSIRNIRSFETNRDGALHVFRYIVQSPEGKTLLERNGMEPLMLALSVVGALVILQLLGFLFSYFRDDRKIRKILAPINEMALRADELSRMSFSEDKFQLIEEAIEHIHPGQTGAEQPLSFGDADLTGVEAAMNNLLLRMRDTYRQQARFVNDASHELRTPIAVIQGYANMLDRWGKSDEKILEEGIEAIRQECEHMNHLVEQLLFLARGDSGRTPLSLTELSLNGMMQEIYEESFMVDENHRYRLKLPDEDNVIRADTGLLKQAVRILIDNAAKYTPEGEEIILSTGREEKGNPWLQVQDLGIGMAGKDIPHVFERFYRSDEVRSRAGTGLGLSIAKWIVDKHGGYFEVLSREGLGTRFRIVLPIQKAASD